MFLHVRRSGGAAGQFDSVEAYAPRIAHSCPAKRCLSNNQESAIVIFIEATYLLPRSFDDCRRPTPPPRADCGNGGTPPPSRHSVLSESLPHLLPRQAFPFMDLGFLLPKTAIATGYARHRRIAGVRSPADSAASVPSRFGGARHLSPALQGNLQLARSPGFHGETLGPVGYRRRGVTAQFLRQSSGAETQKGPPAKTGEPFWRMWIDQACGVVLSSTGAPGPFFLIESMAFCALALLE